MQSQHDELEAKFLEERAALEARYQKLYETLYTKVRMYCNACYSFHFEVSFYAFCLLDDFLQLQLTFSPNNVQRFEIVNGVVEVEGVTDASMEEGEGKANEGKS